jgi:hypothetical protein
MFKKTAKIILIILLIILIAMQFFRPEKNNQGYESVALFEDEIKPREEIKAILKQNCYDCHSNQTQYPWYAEIAPFSFWLEDHIKVGKKHLNFSEWSSYSLKKKDHKLEELLEMVKEDEMPLKSYTIIHGGLSKTEKTLLLQWATVTRLYLSHQLEVSQK